MNRSNSWQNIKKALSTPSPSPSNKWTPRKTKWNKRPTANLNKSFNKFIEFAIEDSDEENISSNNKTVCSHKRSRTKAFPPLNISASVRNTFHESNSRSNSDESIQHEPDTASNSKFLGCHDKEQTRTKSLSFSNKPIEKQLSSSNKTSRVSSQHSNQIKQKIANFQSTFNGANYNVCQQSVLEDSILDSDNDSEATEFQNLPKRKNDSGSNNKNQTSSSISRSALTIISDSSDLCASEKTISSNLIEAQSSQYSTKSDSPSNYPTPTSSYISPDSKKHIKGGLVELLKKSVNQTKSNLSFWTNERRSGLIEPGVKVCIKNIEQSYGRVLVHCGFSSDDKCVKVLCLDPASKQLPLMRVGKTIEVEFDTNGYVIEDGIQFYPHISKILI